MMEKNGQTSNMQNQISNRMDQNSGQEKYTNNRKIR